MIGIATCELLFTGFNFNSALLLTTTPDGEGFGLDAREASAVLATASALGVCSSMAGGFLVDKLKRKHKVFILSGALLFGSFACALLAFGRGSTAAFLYGASFGVMAGLEALAAMILYSSVFGREHMGAIHSAVTAAMTLATGVGPFVISFLLGRGEEAAYFQVLGAMMLLLCGMTIFVPTPALL